jgi:hypothetical protein
MLEAITAEDIYQHGRALEVRYKANPGGGDLLVVSIAAHDLDATPDYVRPSELVLVVMAETMTREAMRERTEAEAARWGTGRVAWIEEA